MNKRSVLSFKYAFEGIWTAFKHEPHLKFHFLAAFGVIIAGLLVGLEKIDWTMLILTIGLVISLELTNTAIEEIVNSFTSDSHPSAKKAKDVAAGAVLIVSAISVIIGSIIFLPYIIK